MGWDFGGQAEKLADLNTWENLFRESLRPLHLIQAFSYAVSNGLPIPPVIAFQIAVFFNEYIEAEGTKSLDACFGLKPGIGQSPPVPTLIRDERDSFLMIHMLKLHGVLGYTISKASKMVAAKLAESDWNHSQYDIEDIGERSIVEKFEQFRRDQGNRWNKLLAAYTLDKWPLDRRILYLKSFPPSLGPDTVLRDMQINQYLSKLKKENHSSSDANTMAANRYGLTTSQIRRIDLPPKFRLPTLSG